MNSKEHTVNSGRQIAGDLGDYRWELDPKRALIDAERV
jgi:hypothetical protein